MGIRYRLVVLALLTIGLALSIISGTDLCNFGGCSETHQYRLLGLSFPAVGIAFCYWVISSDISYTARRNSP